jgi:hypothetical protein
MKVDKLYPKAVILSACKGEDFSEDYENTEELACEIAKLGFPHKQVKGCYNGDIENSFYVELPKGVSDFADLHELARSFDQESILNISEDRQASLIFIKTGESKSIGTFKQVSESEALNNGSYTYDPVNKGFYICEVK